MVVVCTALCASSLTWDPEKHRMPRNCREPRGLATAHPDDARTQSGAGTAQRRSLVIQTNMPIYRESPLQPFTRTSVRRLVGSKASKVASPSM